MTLTKIPFAVLGLQYKIARLPLQLIEDGVFARLHAEAPARLFYERSLGLLDATVGSVLGDAELQERGSALAERSDALSRAARLDAAADRKEEHAAADVEATRSQAVDDIAEARDAKVNQVQDARAEAGQRKRATAQEAEQRIAASKKQADAEAAQRKSKLDEVKRDSEARIRATENKVTAAAQAKADDAKAKQAEAEGKRAQADRIEDLADAEKESRQAALASKS